MGVGGGWGEAGRRNVELVWRVAEAFGGDVAPLLELAQVGAVLVRLVDGWERVLGWGVVFVA